MLLTASTDGTVKIWKRTGAAEGVEFVKSYASHSGPVVAAASTGDGRDIATIGEDGCIKVYDMTTFDVKSMLKVPSRIGAFGDSAVFVGRGNEGIAVTLKGGTGVEVYDLEGDGGGAVRTITVHPGVVTAMEDLGDGMVMR